jgi:hypothetical protein
MSSASLERRPREAWVGASTKPSGDGQLRRAALIAGAGLIVMSALAGFGNIVVLQGLVAPGDAARTASAIAGSEGMFRIGVASLYVVALLDVIVAWSLFRLFGPVNRNVSGLAALLRVAYATVFMVAISQLEGIPALLDGSGYGAAFTVQQRQSQVVLRIDGFHDVWFAGLILFGAHLVVLGYLAYRSGFVPRPLGVLLVVAGVGYGYDSFVRVFSSGSPFAVSSVTFVGEFLFGLWLLVRGQHISVEAAGHEL